MGPSNQTDLASASQESCGFVLNSFGQRISWRKASPIKFHFDPNFSSDFENSLRAAAAVWETVIGRKVFDFIRATSFEEFKVFKDGRNLIYFSSDWSDEKSEQQALTSVFWRENSILEADIIINTKNFQYYVGAKTSGVHFPSLMIHELGHVLGLVHNTQWPTVMWAQLSPMAERMSLSPEDERNIRCEYY